MAVWRFFDYVTLGGKNRIREWLDGLPVEASAAIDYRLLQMERLPQSQWSEKWVSKYRGRDEIYELRIPANKVQYRPLGTYHGPKRFVLLSGAIEKGGKIPTNVLDTAEQHLEEIRSGGARIEPHEYD